MVTVFNPDVNSPIYLSIYLSLSHFSLAHGDFGDPRQGNTPADYLPIYSPNYLSIYLSLPLSHLGLAHGDFGDPYGAIYGPRGEEIHQLAHHHRRLLLFLGVGVFVVAFSPMGRGQGMEIRGCGGS